MRKFILLAITALSLSADLGLAADQQLSRTVRDGDKTLLAADRLNNLITALKGDNFAVREGKLATINLVRLCCGILLPGESALPSCYGNNAGAPYMVYTMPMIPGQAPSRLPFSYRLRYDEAIVLIARTPPPVAYFSYVSYLGLRTFEQGDPPRRRVFASLGNPFNNQTIRTQANSAHNPYNRAFVIVSAFDQGIADRVIAALHHTGFPDGVINLEALPAFALRPGIMPDDDELIFIHRLYLPEYGYEEEFNHYLDSSPGIVLRVTPEVEMPAIEHRPLPVQRLRPRGSSRGEIGLMTDVNRLEESIVASNPGMNAQRLHTSVWLTETFDGIQRGVDLLGENRDTVYLRTDEEFTLADDEFLMVYGVNHEATQKCTYANFSLYGQSRSDGVPVPLLLGMAGAHSRQYAGSALDYFSDENASRLYAWRISRHCGGDPHCTELTARIVKVEGQEGLCDCTNLDPNGRFFVAFRSYLEKSTSVGPAYQELVYDRVIKFTPPPPVISTPEASPNPSTSGTPVSVSFTITCPSAKDVTWRVARASGSCEGLSQATGVLAGGNGTVSVIFSPPAPDTLFITAVDAAGREASPRSIIIVVR